MTDQNPNAVPEEQAATGSPAAEAAPEAVKAAPAKAELSKAEAQKADKRKKKEEESIFPFSVTVGKVYDGPLDLLLDLIRKQDIDIWDIPIAKITAQYLAYVERLKQTDIDTAGEFIYTAALLIQIKSRMLLPRSPVEGAEGEAEDPRLELVERLLEHERFKNAAQMLYEKQQVEAATWSRPNLREFRNMEGTEQEIAADTVDLVRVFREILERAKNRPILNLEEDPITVSQMIDFMRRRLTMEDKPVGLLKLLRNTRSERGLVTMFLAILELVRLQAILLRQDGNFHDIYVKKAEHFEEVINERLSQVRDDWN